MYAPRRTFAVLFCALLLAGCSRQKAEPLPPLEELPADYSLEQAREDGCVVHEDGDIASGHEAWEDFLYYESIKDDYPLLFVSGLSFDGKAYTVSGLEDSERWEKTYSHLKRFEDKAETHSAVYDSYIRYVLVNDDTVTWNQLVHGMFSSRFGDSIPFHSVYTDYIYND